MHRIVFLDRAIFPAPLRRPRFAHEWAEYPATSEAELEARLAGATIVVSSKIPLKGATLAKFPAIRFIAIAGTGYDAFDLDYCREHGIGVSNVRGYAEHTVPEHTFALLLALRRNLLAYRADVEAGLWQKAAPFCLYTHPITDLHGARLGIAGEGAIGQGTARIARGFGMDVVFADHDGPKTGPGPFVPLAELLATADAVALHCPLTERTRHMIGEAQLRAMKKSAVLINTARGGLVDEGALLRALKDGWIAGAGLDVLTREPPREGSPLLELRLPNLIVTPHIAWAGDKALAAFAEQLIANIEAWAQGRPQNLLT
ncbi:MAG TPA: D-2-hydroxyacid dehydrogenase [Burkholderiales bacterium]|jgi:glycerate dehydrogenase|nr:D-2-hydroxyacid dehydrogenase [Burkholderiales bacterium]